MANYIIIGGDGKEYGPVTERDVRQWLAEGRLNGQSLAKAESDAEFRALEKFPEFAGAFGATQPPPLTPPNLAGAGNGFSRHDALEKIKIPALCLKIVAVVNFVLALWNLASLIFFRPATSQLYANIPELQDPQIQKILHLAYGPLGIANDIFCLVMAALIFVGATKMQSLKNYEFAFVAAVLAMIPCLTPCCIIGLPFGIWALVVMSKIKLHFH
jgi:hypothetical protein